MVSPEQITKTKFIIDQVVRGFFIADHRLAILDPLLDDEAVYRRWDRTPGAEAVGALRWTLYSAIILEMKSILFDEDKRAASLGRVVRSLNNPDFVRTIRAEFCEPPGVTYCGENERLRELTVKQIQDGHIADAEQRFDELLPHLLDCYQKMRNSDVGKRVIDARDQLIAHREITTIKGERRLYNPADFELTWGDPGELIRMARVVIFDANLLINNSSYDLDGFLGGHREAARVFWGVNDG